MWSELISDSFLRPRTAARKLLASAPSTAVLMEAAVAIAALGVLLGYGALRLAPGAVDPVTAVVLSAPLLGAVIQLGIMAIGVLLIFAVGRVFGGTGTRQGALAVVVWLNAMMVLLQAVQLVALALLPVLALFVTALGIVWAFRAISCFVAELHGFRSAMAVFAGVVVVLIVLALIAGLLGILPQEVS